jgi:hypothetical protein
MATGDPTNINVNSIWTQPNRDYITASPPNDFWATMAEVKERVSAIEDRLAILRPDKELEAKYPALKEAYDHYKLIEKLVREQSKNGT